MTAATRSDGTALSAIVLALGVALGGWFVGQGFTRGRTASRFVEVKGLAEREYGVGGPTFVFTKLNQLKPAMVAEATPNARAAAEQFAAAVRVVSTVQYLLV
jgi:hypothetical protein